MNSRGEREGLYAYDWRRAVETNRIKEESRKSCRAYDDDDNDGTGLKSEKLLSYEMKERKEERWRKNPENNTKRKKGKK